MRVRGKSWRYPARLARGLKWMARRLFYPADVAAEVMHEHFRDLQRWAVEVDRPEPESGAERGATRSEPSLSPAPGEPLRPAPLAAGGHGDAFGSDAFALQTLPIYADVVLPLEAWLMPGSRVPRPTLNRRQPGDLAEVFVQSSGIAFLASVLLVPFGCSYAAGSLYGHPRDGPQRARGYDRCRASFSRTRKRGPASSLIVSAPALLQLEQTPHAVSDGDHPDDGHDPAKHGTR